VINMILVLCQAEVSVARWDVREVMGEVSTCAKLFARNLQQDDSYETGSSSLERTHHLRANQVLPRVVDRTDVRLEPRPLRTGNPDLDWALYTKGENIWRKFRGAMKDWRNERHDGKFGAREWNLGRQVNKDEMNDVSVEVMFQGRRDEGDGEDGYNA
jgi:hypothetical protein